MTGNGLKSPWEGVHEKHFRKVQKRVIIFQYLLPCSKDLGLLFMVIPDFQTFLRPCRASAFAGSYQKQFTVRNMENVPINNSEQLNFEQSILTDIINCGFLFQTH